jgi:hypothetical protein
MSNLGKYLLSLLPRKGALRGLEIKPFDVAEEPGITFARALRAELEKRGVRFTTSAEWEGELSWDILGGSQVKVKVGVTVGPFTIRTDVREGWPSREVVDFDITKVGLMDQDKKVLMFIERAAVKIAERLEERYKGDLGRG